MCVWNDKKEAKSCSKILSLMMALVMALSLSPMAMAESFTDGHLHRKPARA